MAEEGNMSEGSHRKGDQGGGNPCCFGSKGQKHSLAPYILIAKYHQHRATFANKATVNYPPP